MNTLALIANLRIQDLLDILFLTVVAYHLYLWFRGTKAFKALIGLFALGVIFTIAQTWGLFLTTWVFQILWQVLVILLIILFQSEIRQALEKFDPLRTLGLRKTAQPGQWTQRLSEAVFMLAERKVGVLIMIERSERVEECVTSGQALDGKPSSELLTSIFQKESPLHDGAILIKEGRIQLVACYLPLSSEEGLPKEWGTRHRAAMGLSERCDAIMVVVSEERGEVTLIVDRKVFHPATPGVMSQMLLDALRPPSRESVPWKEKVRPLFLNQWKAKYGTLLLVLVFWLLLAGQQDFEVAFAVPLEMRNVPATMKITEPLDPKVRIRVRGLRKDASVLSEKNVHAEIDLSTAATGKRSFALTRDLFMLPNERVYIVSIEPSQITFKFHETPGS
ncbi:MAG TPA: diadenylate cyclase CdaA [Desulfatiglandales bacterium]|nr:diadenylate cyclase CdaA [Desulfatiglandales bacterium]